MTFTPNIPTTGQSLGVSRPLILGNFSNYFTVMSVNHIAPNLTGQGKHKFVQMPVQGAAPALVATEGALYTKTLAGVAELYYKRNAAATEFQFTGPLTAAAQGSVTLYGGIILKWGSRVGSGAVLFSPAFLTNVWSVQVTGTTVSQVVSVSTVTNSGFNVTTSGAGTVYYMAVGN